MAFKMKGMGFGEGTGSAFKLLGLLGGGGKGAKFYATPGILETRRFRVRKPTYQPSHVAEDTNAITEFHKVKSKIKKQQEDFYSSVT